MTYNNPKLILDTEAISTNTITWRSPSNIALVKYWGKFGIQQPRNASVSFTLQNAYTETSITVAPKTSNAPIDLDFLFEEQPNEAFRTKQLAFLESLLPIFPFLAQLKLSIRSHNSFPHSAGIASSASSMAALACALCSMEQEFFNTLHTHSEFWQKASYIARLGSGSACRSVYPQAAVWGATDIVPNSSDFYAIPVNDNLHPIFTNFHDDILLVSRDEKSVSSRVGHSLMDNNPFADVRYAQSKTNLYQLMNALKTGDLERFGEITENEALTLHALMMTSNPSFILMHPNTLILIEKIRAFRTTTKLPVYFTLDAGPNVHLLYPDNIASEIKEVLQNDWLTHCVENQYLPDKIGMGAERIL